MSHKHNKRRRAQQGAISLKVPTEFVDAMLPVLGLSWADLAAAPDHCRTPLDIYMWKMDLPRDVAEAQVNEKLRSITDDDVDRVLAPLEAR